MKPGIISHLLVTFKTGSVFIMLMSLECLKQPFAFEVEAPGKRWHLIRNGNY